MAINSSKQAPMSILNSNVGFSELQNAFDNLKEFVENFGLSGKINPLSQELRSGGAQQKPSQEVERSQNLKQNGVKERRVSNRAQEGYYLQK